MTTDAPSASTRGRNRSASPLSARLRRIVDAVSGWMLLAMFLSTFYPAFRITRAETGSTGLAILAALCFLLVWVGIMVAAGRVFSAAWKQLARAAAHPLTFPALLLTGMLLRIAYACLSAPLPEQDFRTVLNAALRFASDDFSYVTEPYFQVWGYQQGMVILEGLLLKVSGGFIGLPAFVWLLCSTAIGWLVWRIGTGMASGRNRPGLLLGTALCLLAIPSILYAAVLSNDHPATCLLYGAFALLLAQSGSARRNAQSRNGTPAVARPYGRLPYDAAAGAMLALGHLIRPVGMFALIAVAAWLLLQPATSRRHTLPLRAIRLATVAGVFLLTLWTVNHAAVSAGWTDGPMTNRDPLYKVTVGLNPNSHGWYSGEDAKDLDRFAPVPDRRERNQTLIRERLSHPVAVAGLMLDKFVSFWGDFDGCILWGLGANAPTSVIVILSVAAQLDYAALLLFAALAPLMRSLRLLRRHRHRRLSRAPADGVRQRRRDLPERSGVRIIRPQAHNETLLLLRILLIGYVLVHLIVEIQTRYRYFLMPALCLMAADGIPTFVALARLHRMRRADKKPAIAAAREKG